MKNNPHPLADMICQQAHTGQPVWIRIAPDFCFGTLTFDQYIYRGQTTTPDWNIPNAEYSFTPFDEPIKRQTVTNMKGIREEDVIAIFDDVFEGKTALCDVEAVLKRHIKELDPWLPIESAPKDRKLRLYDGEKQHDGKWFNESGNWVNINAFIIYPTHYKPLPDDPKD